MVAPHTVQREVEFSIIRGWICSVIPKRARAVLDTRAVTNAAELVDALQDHLILEGERTEGQAAIFRHVSSEISRERVSSFICYRYGKSGHKATECWAEKAGTSSFGSSAFKSSGSMSSGPTPTVTCYSWAIRALSAQREIKWRNPRLRT